VTICISEVRNVQYVSGGARVLTLSLTGVGPFGHTPLKTQNTLKVLKARYCQKLGIPQEVSQACFEITTLLNLGLISL
jgi:hypothetical protein